MSLKAQVDAARAARIRRYAKDESNPPDDLTAAMIASARERQRLAEQRATDAMCNSLCHQHGIPVDDDAFRVMIELAIATYQDRHEADNRLWVLNDPSLRAELATLTARYLDDVAGSQR